MKGVYRTIWDFPYPSIEENQMEKNMEHEMTKCDYVGLKGMCI